MKKMPYDTLVNSIRHLEATLLTRDYANAMNAMLPALKAALKAGVTGMSVAADVSLWEATVPKLKGWMGGTDGDCYRCEENLAKLRAELALREIQKQTDLPRAAAAIVLERRLNAGED